MDELKMEIPHLYYEVKVEGGKLAPDPKPIEDEKQKKIEILSEENELLKKQLVDLQKTTEDRFNTIAILLQDLQKNNKK